MNLKNLFLFLLIGSLGSCNPIYNLGSSPSIPFFSTDKELEVSANSNSNSVHGINFSYKHNSNLYYTMGGTLGNRNTTVGVSNTFEKYITKEYKANLGIGLRDIFDKNIGVQLNAKLLKNRNIISRNFIQNRISLPYSILKDLGMPLFYIKALN